MSQYIITDGSRFIYRNHSGKFVPTPSEAMADTYTKKQADGICKNSLPKGLRTIFHPQKYDNVPKGIKQVTSKDLLKNTEKTVDNSNVQSWLHKLGKIKEFRQEAEKREEELRIQLKKLEEEKIDIEHYIEFQNFNASQGYKASKELKICRMKRRAVKNEIEVVNIILNQKIKEMTVDEIQKKIEEFDKRTYHPRTRTDLFDL